MTDPVQSIRIASNLADRFGAVVRQSSMFTDSLAEMELRIGEAQQLYPEIWRHLDDARKVLLERGRELGEFDALRRAELVELGVTDVDSRTEIDYVALIAGRIRTRQVRTATFNVAGYARAVAACKALMAAMPEIDWKALAHAEDAEIRAAGSLQAGKWVGIVKWVAIIGALGALAFGFYKWIGARGDSDDREAEQLERDKQREAVTMREEVAERRREIAHLTRAYYETCEVARRDKLVAALREDSQLPRAKEIESTPCKLAPPACRAGTPAAMPRLAAAFGLARADASSERCRGGIFGDAQHPMRGLAIAITAPTTNGTGLVTMHGITAADGASDLVPFGELPAEIDSIETVDLDGDGIDEIVLASTTNVTVERVRDGKLVQIAGPAVAIGRDTGSTCTGRVNLPEDGARRLLVVTVADDAKGKTCPKPGEHTYELQGDKLVERK